jgi:hypothetical protein
VERLEDEADTLGAHRGATVLVERVSSAREPARARPSASSSPASSASSVDLPAPDAPTMATVSPATDASETSSTMVSGPSGC